MQNLSRSMEVNNLVAVINAAYKQMVEEKMLLGCEIVTVDNDGNIRIESARECYERVYQ